MGPQLQESAKILYKTTKEFRAFKSLSKELASRVEALLPIVRQIESMQDVEELKDLKETMSRAYEVVNKCPYVEIWDKSKVTREIKEINKDMIKFCQVQVPLIRVKNQGLYAEAINNIVQIIMRNQGLYEEA